eukprot:350299-Chlamydomonas_euryale.AAC.3
MLGAQRGVEAAGEGEKRGGRGWLPTWRSCSVRSVMGREVCGWAGQRDDAEKEGGRRGKMKAKQGPSAKAMFMLGACLRLEEEGNGRTADGSP